MMQGGTEFPFQGLELHCPFVAMVRVDGVSQWGQEGEGLLGRASGSWDGFAGTSPLAPGNAGMRGWAGLGLCHVSSRIWCFLSLCCQM